jgi:hypothetical protein
MSFLWVVLMKRPPGTWVQSHRKTHEINYMPDLNEWGYKVMSVPSHFRQNYGVSCGLAVCMFIASIADGNRKQFRACDISQELAT